MKSFTVNLTKEDTLIIKGIAIIAIVLHNYFHIFNGVVRENEFGYSPDNFLMLWSSLQNSFLHFFVNFISMYGHYGVVAFFFVSGYGLTKKYKGRELEHDFILKNAIKLWKLFVPILVFYVILAIIRSFLAEDLSSALNHIGIILYNAISRVLFMSNFSEYTVFGISGPWWFFSAIFQMYVLYKLVFSKVSSTVGLFAIALLMVGIQLFCYLNKLDISLIRYNAPAWIPAFILGMIFARYRFKIPVIILLFIELFCFTIDSSFYTWITFSSLFIFVFVIFHLFIKKSRLRSSFIEIGKLSAYIFVTNTFVRTFLYILIFKTVGTQPVWLIILTGLIDLFLCFVIAWIYKKVTTYLYDKVIA